MSKAIIVGDPHIGKNLSIGKPGLGTELNSRIQDQFKILDWVLQTAISNDVFNIILTGDVFEDSKPHPTLLSLFLDWIHRCGSHNINIHIVLGNHEIIKNGNYLLTALDVISSSGISNAFIYKSIDTLHLEKISYTFLPFRDRRGMGLDTYTECIAKLKDQVDYESVSIPLGNLKVLVGHMSLEKSLPIGDELDDVNNEIICSFNMFFDYNYVWMGHIHKPQVCCEIPRLAHIGSMDLSDFGETDHTKIIVLVDPELPNHFKEIPIPTRKLRRIRISVPENEQTTDFILNAITEFNTKKSIKDAIVKLEIKLPTKDSQNVDRDIIINLIYNLGTHYLSNFSESKSTSIIKSVQNNIVDMTISVDSAVKIWADNNILDEEIKTSFLEEANEVICLFNDLK